MSINVYPVRLFGGRMLGVTYDSGAGTLTIQGQSVTLSTLPQALQDAWSDVVALNSTSLQTSGKPAFGGNQVQQVVGDILDATPSWRTAVESAVDRYVRDVTADGAVGDPQSWVF